ncbi:MAG: YebC/PmpR family DNA-binding transcriptional regulator [Rikenellaceae bacterium]
MGRAFEYRKARKMKRWGNMSRTFTKIGKEISISVKAAGPDPGNNTRLRILLQNAKAANMPKDTIDRAIKKAISKDMGDYKEIVYEGYGPFGIAILVETATDNSTRTVANVRSYFNKFGGSLGTSGSVEFMFDHHCVFKARVKDGASIDMEELELEIIDFGGDELFEEDGELIIYGAYEAYGTIQKFLEDKEDVLEIISGEFERTPMETKEVTEEQRVTLDKLLDRFEEDEDVTNVYHNIKESEEEVSE